MTNQEIIRHISSFPTRHSLSKGIWDACEWCATQFKSLSGIEVEQMKYMLPAGRRIPKETECVQVIATLRGKSDRIVIIGAHLDSLNLSDVPNGRAPGANDDGSGVAAVMNAAQFFAGKSPECTMKFVLFSGEEQGLLGSRALATRAKSENWKIEAVLSNDTIGSSENLLDQKDKKQIRVFSDQAETHQSRELARFIEFQCRTLSVKPKLVMRADRFGRGGDHTPFAEAGFNAVRLVEVFEEYSRQHTDQDLEKFIDYAYLEGVCKVNNQSLESLANSQIAPTGVTAARDNGHHTRLHWKGNPEGFYRVFWRETDSATWQDHQDVHGLESLLMKVSIDDHIFAVASQGGIPVIAK